MVLKSIFTTKTGYLITGSTEWSNEKNKLTNVKDLQTGVNNTSKEWYTNCIGMPARSSIFLHLQSLTRMKNRKNNIYGIAGN